MSDKREQLRSAYAAAFRRYLSAPTESSLEDAYELGREAVTTELGLLELAGIHNEVLGEALADSSAGAGLEGLGKAAGDFFLESLATFEMTQRGFQEAREEAVLQRELALSLQRRLLPARLPPIPGYLAAARYQAGSDGVEVGGDWYDVITLADDRVGLAIGDVVGRGVTAASTMGQLRVALRAYALQGEAPSVVAARVAGFVNALDEEQMATCLYFELASATGDLKYINAAHPPPLLAGENGAAAFLQEEVWPPFGVASGIAYGESSARLEPGATLVLYTDGLVEARGVPIDEGLKRLRETVAGGASDPETLCDQVMEEVITGTPRDDVAILAIQRIASP